MKGIKIESDTFHTIDSLIQRN